MIRPGSAPRFAYYHPDLADHAAWMLRQRTQHYAARVAAGQMDQADADRGILVMGEIARLWRHAADRMLPAQPFAVDRPAMVEALAAALDGARALAFKNPLDPILADRRDSLDAMLWWMRRFTNGPLHMTELTLAIRNPSMRKAA